MQYPTIKKVNKAEKPKSITKAYWYIKPLWNLLAFIEHFFINDEIPSGPKPSINFPSQNFQKNNPIFLEDLTKIKSYTSSKYHLWTKNLYKGKFKSTKFFGISSKEIYIHANTNKYWQRQEDWNSVYGNP